MRAYGISTYIFIIGLFLANTLLAQRNNQLHHDIKKLLLELKLTGAVWTIVDSNGITTDCAGLKNAESKESFKPTDKVHVGSITKTILAVGVLHLATEGKINLDESVSKYLTDTKFINKWNATNPVTIRHLLNHTSGLEDLRLWQMFSMKASPTDDLEYAFTKNPSVLKIRTRPGSMFSYSNMGYTLLGMVIEAVTKESYENYLDKNLLLPLEMKSSTFKFVSQVGNNADSSLAMGHLDNQKIFPALPIYLRPAGQFTTTAYNMGLFLRFLMGDGILNGEPFIKKELLSEIGNPLNTEAVLKGLEIGYAFGAMKRDRYGHIGIAHSGNIFGYRAMIYMFPNSKKAFFISHNMDSETANYERFNEILIKFLNLKKQILPVKTIDANNLSDWEGHYIPVVAKFQPLAFLDIISGFTKVSIKDDKVILAPFQKPAKVLTYMGDSKFVAEGRISTSHVFYKNNRNKKYISDGFSTYKEINTTYLLIYWSSFLLGCAGLIYLLISGIIQLFKFRKQITKQPVWFSFLSITLLLVPIPFFFMQPFVSLGDITAASVILAISTCLLPLGLFISGIQHLKNGMPKLYNKIDFIAITFSIQLLIVFIFWGLIPFRLWI